MRWPKALLLGSAAALVLGGSALAARPGPTASLPEPLVMPMREVGVRGGRFVVAVTSDPKTLNPLMANESSSSDVTDRLFGSLVEYDHVTHQPRASLAKSWTASRDGLTWTWRLRRGARFSDGRPITAEDVLFSFAVAYDTTLRSPLYDLLTPHGQRMEVSARDPHTVVVRLARPHALVVPAVGSLRILPKHVLEPAWRAGRFASSYGLDTAPGDLVTSGPWKLARFRPRELTVLTPNPHWCGVDARGQRLPYLEELVFLVVPDQNAAVLKFMAGEVDGLDNVKAEDYRTFVRGQARGGYTVHDLGAALTSNFLWFNLNTVKEPRPGKEVGRPYVNPVKYGWFSQRDFRRAVSMAIDRDAIIRSVFFGQGAKSWSLMTPGYKAFHDPRAVGPDYDPRGARRLLARLGFRDRDRDGVLEDAKGRAVRFTLETSAGSNTRVQMANFVRDDLAKVGIQCVVAPVDFNTMINHMRQDFAYDAILGGLGAAVPPDPGMGGLLYLSSGSSHVWNALQRRPETPEEARLDRLFDRLLLPGSPAARRRIASEMSRVINDQCWLIWLPTMKVQVPVRNRFGNVRPSILPHRLLWNIETVYVKAAARRA